MSGAPKISPHVARFFLAHSRRLLRKNFHATRLLAGHSPDFPQGPLIIFTNHASWWDPLACFVLARLFLPDRNHFGPIDAHALDRYPIFKRLGFFGIPSGSHPLAAARTFLAQSRAILAQNDAVLWLTPQGEFVDPRLRPISFQPGLAHLIARYPDIPTYPLAFEYPYWKERTPELLAAFGPRLQSGQSPESSLTSLQNHLAQAAITKDPSQFQTLLGGSGGVGGFYDRWRNLAARLTGKTFTKEHSSLTYPNSQL